MAILSDITLYPIKSCAGIALREATLTRAGLMTEGIYDREWMVVDADGNYLTQREHPKLALVTPRIKANTLELRAPGMLRLEIPLGLPDPESAPARTVLLWDLSLKAYDCDDLTAAWFTSFLGLPCRLVRFHPEAQNLANMKWTGGVEAPTLFSDGYPVLVIGAESLRDLNERLHKAGRAPLPMNRFRPNLVVDGLGAYEEDYIDTFDFDGAVLKPVKPCPRCPMPSVDQATGTFGPDPLEILQSYRAKPEVDGGICFGMNNILLEGEGQRVHVGQQVGAELAF
ncbi:hypothetical protein IP91_04996 [Pseudoduganella lurida]|uniref:MOSC domain-containing protein n=1 Tax=Pseudoduganella lurida TaxID=1036180 RepID=A0A562QVC5_9BURK|nr:MOSC N-terminal beta barrel domain-containing protein [Pseudoduganella lurida]TWI60801.1 hypothetical protein IP91_04996 [Pseudoduganella lurida]